MQLYATLRDVWDGLKETNPQQFIKIKKSRVHNGRGFIL